MSMPYIDKQAFCVMTYADRIRVYLYYTNRPCSIEEISKVCKTPYPNLTHYVYIDIKRGMIKRISRGVYKLSRLGMKYCEDKRTLECIIDSEKK